MKKILLLLYLCTLAVFLPGCNESDLFNNEAERLICEPSDELKADMLSAVNAARARDQVCNGQMYNATGTLTWNDVLMEAADIQSTDLATSFADSQTLSHTGSDGRTVAERTSDLGYDWILVGENLAAGVDTSEWAVDEWLKSTTGHCEVLMNPGFTEMGAACVANRDAYFQTYWTLVLATPR